MYLHVKAYSGHSMFKTKNRDQESQGQGGWHKLLSQSQEF